MTVKEKLITLIGNNWKWFRLKYYRWSGGFTLWGLYQYLEDTKEKYSDEDLTADSLRKIVKDIFDV